MRVEFVVAVGKKEQARSWADVDGGAIVAQGEGKPDAPADITFTAKPPDAQALHDGSLDLSVSFMRGQVKMAGANPPNTVIGSLYARERPVLRTRVGNISARAAGAVPTTQRRAGYGRSTGSAFYQTP